MKYDVQSQTVRCNKVVRVRRAEAKQERCVGENPCTRKVEAHLVRRASVTRMGTSIAAIFENYIGTVVQENPHPPQEKWLSDVKR